MSLILDALKKSEEERSEGSDPRAISMQAGHHYRRRQAASKLPWLIVLGLLLAALLWWFWPRISSAVQLARNPAQNPSQTAGVNTGAASNTAQQSAVNTDSAGVQTFASPESAQGSVSTAGFDTRTSASTGNESLPPRHQIRELWQLPADFQSRVPAMEFSFHVYSDVPEKRTIIINGRRMREGQMVTSKIKLRLITETGIVLHGHGRFFHIDVVEKW